MASLHSWAGLIPGWVLFLVFLFGTSAFFTQEINAWMRPELKGQIVSPSALEAARKTLSSSAAKAESWTITFPHPRGGDPLWLSWPPNQKGAAWHSIALDPATGRVAAVRDTKGGRFLYAFHYELHYAPNWVGRYVVLIAALAMFVAILSGIVTHKKIFADFFTLRFSKGQRSWLDAHNVTSVLALPFHLMITYTGLVIFASMLVPWPITANFDDADAYYDAAYATHSEAGASGIAAPVVPLSLLAKKAREAWGRDPAHIIITHPGDAAAVVEVETLDDRLGRATPALHLSGVTGEPIDGATRTSAVSLTQSVMVQLHAGWFAAPVLRWLYFIAGTGGTVMIVTGLVLWTVKRRSKLPDPDHPHFGFKIVERLNIGVIVGAPLGIAVYFLANRLLPIDLPHRSEWEIHSLFIAWGALFVWSIGRPARRAWIETLVVAAVLYALVPIVSALTTTRGLIASLIDRDWVFAGFDLVMLAMAALLALAARRVAAHQPKLAARRKPPSTADACA